MEDKNIFVNAEGAFKAIKDAVKYLGDNGYMNGLLVLGSTEKSGCSEMFQLFAGSQLDVAARLIMAAEKSENIKDVIMKVGRIIVENGKNTKHYGERA